MPYVDVHTIHVPSTGTVAPAAWGVGLRDNQEFFIDPPSCSVLSGSTQAASNGIHTILTANQENFDNNAMHSTVTNNSRITFQTAGRYLLGATVEYAGFTGTNTRIFTTLFVNGVTQYDMDIRPNINNASTPNRVNVSRTLTFAVGDYVEARANQNSGGNLNVQLLEFYALFLTR